jgi:Right handed beta helix region
MRRIVQVVCAAALGIALSASYAAAAVAQPAATAAQAWGSGRVIVVWPGHSIQAAVNRAKSGDTVLIKPGIYHQGVLIRKDGINLVGSGDSWHGTVLESPSHPKHNLCNQVFGSTGVCVFAKKVNARTGQILRRVHNVAVSKMLITGFGGSGVFGYGVNGMAVLHVSAIKDGGYGISRFRSSRTIFAYDTATGNDEAGFYVGDSPHANAIVTHDYAAGNTIGIFIRHARHVLVYKNLVTRNCQGIFVLDDGQRGGVGNATIKKNAVIKNNKFCPKGGDQPIDLSGGGILLLGATHTRVLTNAVIGNKGSQVNSGGIVVASANPLTKGSNPRHDLIAHNAAFLNSPADLIWDGTGTGIRFVHNACKTSIPTGLCH